MLINTKFDNIKFSRDLKIKKKEEDPFGNYGRKVPETPKSVSTQTRLLQQRETGDLHAWVATEMEKTAQKPTAFGSVWTLYGQHLLTDRVVLLLGMLMLLKQKWNFRYEVGA